MPDIKLIVIGGSAGALPALIEPVRGLPGDLPAAICVALHTSPSSPGLLPTIIGRQTGLHCVYAQDRHALLPGTIYFAPADHHLLIEDRRARTSHGPRENGFRPAVDPLFRTAARAYGSQVAGIVLSGNLADGSSGLAAIERAGGLSIVQDPQEAPFPGMPLAAIRGVDVDHILKVADIGPLIQSLVNGGPTREVNMAADASKVPDPAEAGALLHRTVPPGDLTPLSCPECGGALWEENQGRQAHFRCHVGHAFNGESLAEYVSDEVESALWTAMRVLEEHAHLQERMAERSESFQLAASAGQFRDRAVDSRRQAEILRKLLVKQTQAEATS